MLSQPCSKAVWSIRAGGRQKKARAARLFLPYSPLYAPHPLVLPPFLCYTIIMGK